MGTKRFIHYSFKYLLVVLAVSLLMHSVAFGIGSPTARESNIDSQIRSLRGELEHVGHLEQKQVQEYIAIRDERVKADNEVTSINNQIRAAEQRQRVAQEQAEKARAEYAEAQAKFDEAESERKEADRLRQQAIANLYRGSSNTENVPSVLSAEPREIQNVVRKRIFLKNYNDKQILTIADASSRASEAILERLAHEDARVRAEEAEAIAQSEADLLEPLREKARDAQAKAREKEKAEEALVGQLRSKKASYQREINQLEAESARIAEELRRKQREQEQQNNNNNGGNTGGGNNGGSNPAPSPSAMTRPVGGPVTSPFGWRTHPIYGDQRLHAGVDFGSGHGTPIRAARSGQVVTASFLNGYGNTIIIMHSSGISTLYAHQSSFAVSNGANVAQGQIIGYVGATGGVTGPHLHWEVRVNGTPVNPMPYL